MCILVRYVMGAYFNRRFVHHRSMGKKEEIRRTGEKPATNRDARGRFVAGNRANPGGRPKTPKEIKEALGRLTSAAIETYQRVLEDPEASDKDKIKVAQDILDRVLGKPQQSVALDETDSRIRITIDGGDSYAN